MKHTLIINIVTTVTVTMVTLITVTRKEIAKVKEAKGWSLIFGRRKVGKTFLVKNFIEYDLYFLIKRGGGALIEGGPLNRIDDYDLLLELIINSLKANKIVIVDEFQRLPHDFIENLQMQHPNGKLILLGSSMHVAQNITSKNSPLLGLLSEIKLSIISPIDIFRSLTKEIGPEYALSLAPYMRDPWTLKYLNQDPIKTIRDILEYSKNAIPALIGETFIDEDRFLSEIYEGVLRSIASGRNKLNDVSNQLFSKKLISANNPSLVRPYVKNMMAMDLIERVPIYDERGFYYSVKSKIMELYYYLDEKYGIECETKSLINEVISERLPIHVQFFIGELMAELLDGTFRYEMTKDFDTDIIITKRKKPIFVGEVKWSKHVKLKEVYKFLKNTERYKCRKAIISKVPIETDEIEVITPEEILKLIGRSSS